MRSLIFATVINQNIKFIDITASRLMMLIKEPIPILNALLAQNFCIINAWLIASSWLKPEVCTSVS